MANDIERASDVAPPPRSRLGQGVLPSGHLRDGLRLYAIGDVHGMSDLLDHMATLIADDLAEAPASLALTIFLGDYIDRGPASRAVVDRLVRRDFPTDIMTLRGNHEQLLLDGLDNAAHLGSWLQNGGDTTARSYGVDPRGSGVKGLEDVKAALLARIPAEHLAFLVRTALSLPIDGYFFCHAGIEPGVRLDQQSPNTLLWIRGPFHLSTADHGKVIVHGHTPGSQPESLFNRINVDTGAFASDVLTCVVLEGATRRFLSTR